MPVTPILEHRLGAVALEVGLHPRKLILEKGTEKEKKNQETGNGRGWPVIWLGSLPRGLLPAASPTGSIFFSPSIIALFAAPHNPNFLGEAST
ncbi:hypothetical protein V2G26_016531 [Clonostachys chloroleuca]